MKKIDNSDPLSRSADPVALNVERLASLFPEAVAEGKVDFEVLRQLLGDKIAAQDERFGLHWKGKAEARLLALSPSTGTLRPCPEESVDWDKTQNIFIEGENLEVLKLLQKAYVGKVKLIYIDPPYNVGADVVYVDDFRDGISNYLQLTNQVDGDGRRLTANVEGNGRFHTSWLNMMYSRIRIARELLQRDGLLMVSIDDHEVDNLRKVCNEVFGEENFVAQLIWNTEGHTDNQFDVKVNHEYIAIFARSRGDASLGFVIDPNTRPESNLWKGFAENSITKNGTANPPSEVLLPAGFPCTADSLSLLPTVVPDHFFDEVKRVKYIGRSWADEFQIDYPLRLDPLQVSNFRTSTSCRMFSGWANINKLKAFISNQCRPIDDGGDKVSFFLSDRGVIYYRREREKARNIVSVLRNFGTTEKMRSELSAMGIPFKYPKPLELMSYLVRVGAEEGGIVMDFFSGSGSTAHATLAQSVADRADRRFIAVQLQQPLDPDDTDQLEAIRFCNELGRPKTIAEITKERLRRAVAKLKAENPLFAGDLGFRVYTLDSTNLKPWDPQPADLNQQLELGIDHIKPGRSEADLLTELLLKLGLELTVPIEEREIAGHKVYVVGFGALIACLSLRILRKDAEPLAFGIAELYQSLRPAALDDGDGSAEANKKKPKAKPARESTTLIFRDAAFEDDVAKVNLAAILEQRGLRNLRSI